MTVLLFALIGVAALLGAPLFLVIAAFALVGFASLGTGADIYASLIEPVRDVVTQDIFLAIPLFTFAGFLMAAAKTPTRLVNLSRAFLGWMPGGIAIVALVACAFFTAFTGASGVTIIAMGGLLFPILLRERYPENFSLGLMTTGGSRGLIFPPSLPLILYATIAAIAFSPIIEERMAAGPPDGWLTVQTAPTQAETPAAKPAAQGDEADDELEALLGDDDDEAPAAAAKSAEDEELEALLGDDDEDEEEAPAEAPPLSAEDAELEDLLGDDDEDEDAETAPGLSSPEAVVAAPAPRKVSPWWDRMEHFFDPRPGRVSLRKEIDRDLAMFSGVFVKTQQVLEGKDSVRGDLWRTFVSLERDRKPTPEKLFIAGAIPGTLMVIAIAMYAVFIGVRRKVPRTPFRVGAVFTSLRDAWAEIPIPFLIIVGIYGGFFTAQEAAGVTAFYVLCVEVFIYRDISLKRLPKVMLDSMVLVGGVMMILIAALALKNYLVLAEIPQALRDMLTEHISDPLMFLLLLNVFLLIVGCLMDIFSAIMVVVPLIVPLAVAYDVHPVHLGVIFLTNLEIGYSTPPVGINLFIASLRFQRPVVKLYAACLPFLAILLVGLGLITYWPDLSMWLVRMTGME